MKPQYVTAEMLKNAKWRGTELLLNPMGKWEAGVHYQDAWEALAENINEQIQKRLESM